MAVINNLHINDTSGLSAGFVVFGLAALLCAPVTVFVYQCSRNYFGGTGR